MNLTDSKASPLLAEWQKLACTDQGVKKLVVIENSVRGLKICSLKLFIKLSPQVMSVDK